MRNITKLFFSILFIVLAFTVFFCAKNQKQDIVSKNRVYYLSIIQDFGVVSPSYSNYIKKNLAIAANDPYAKAFIIEIDTPGGTLSDAHKISTQIKNSKIKTIAFVNDAAYSAGAIISLASDYVVIAQGGKIGDAYPIVMDPSSGQASSIKDKKVYAKMMSGLRALMKAFANKRVNRLINDISEGNETYKHIKQKNSIRNLPKIFAAMVDPDIELTIENDGFSLAKGELLTLTSKEAYDIGASDGIYNNLDDILKAFKLENHELVLLKATTEDRLLSILTHPAVTSLLLSLGMLGMIMELWTAGWGIPGTIGLLALSLFFYGSFVGGDASYQSLILFLIGLVLVLVEIFITPGFGILGFVGIVAFFLSFMSALGVDFLNIQNNVTKVGEALLIIFSSLFLVIIIIIVFYRYFPKSKSFSKITLRESKITALSHKDNKALIGKKGVAITTLRPSGMVLIAGSRYDAVTQGSFITKGSDIEIIASDEGQIIVKQI